MVRLLISTVVAGVILFVWGFVAWGLLPMHQTSGGEFKDEVAVGAALMSQAPVTGVYWLPAPPEQTSGPEFDAWTERHEAGPLAMVVVNREGRAPMAPSLFLTGGAVTLAQGLLISGLVFVARGSLRRYVGRVLFVVVLGLLVGVAADLKYWNWFYLPADWTIMNVLDHVIGFALAGLAVAAIISPRERAAEAA